MSALSLNVIRFGSWLVFVVAWLLLLIQTITRWGLVSVGLHYDAVTLLVLLCALWGSMAKEKGRELELFCICVTTVILLDLVHKVA
jgi:hypothetical protein